MRFLDFDARHDLLICKHNRNQVGDTAGAIQHYELAGTHCVEVPRMLFERGRVEDLEEYITQVPIILSFLLALLPIVPPVPSTNASCTSNGLPVPKVVFFDPTTNVRALQHWRAGGEA